MCVLMVMPVISKAEAEGQKQVGGKKQSVHHGIIQ